MSSAIVLVAEVSNEVGLGHLAEVRAVADGLRRRGAAAMCLALSGHAFDDGIECVADYRALLERLEVMRPRAVAWSLRTDGWRAIWPLLEPMRARHLWIADIAAECPPVDALVVPTLEPQWTRSHLHRRVFAGPAYVPLDLRGSRDVPPIGTRGRDVLLTLGGADPTEASLRMAPALAGTRSTVVVGPLFRHRDRLVQVAAEAGLDTIVAPDGLRDLLLAHRLVISSGGNTLFEAAAAGTPALVAWEASHEEAQGRAFAACGTARVVGCGARIDVNRVRHEVVSLLQSPELDRMSAAGPSTVDGRGSDRIAGLLVDLAAGVAA